MPSPLWRGYPGSLIATAKSGKFKLGARITYNEEYAGQYADAFAFANAHPRASIWSITLPGIGAANFIVDETSCDSDRGQVGTVSVSYTYLGSVPPEEFSLAPSEINPSIERNSFFSTLTIDDLRKAKAAFLAASAAGQTSITNAIAGTTNSVLTTKLVNKWLRGEETWYLASFKFQHSLYSFSSPTVTVGGIIQAPFGTFSGVPPGGLSWIRLADDLVWSNGLWKLTRTWLGAPGGWWDTDLYV